MTGVEPSPREFSVLIARKGEQVSLKLLGALTEAAAPSLYRALTNAIRAGRLLVVVDFSELQGLDAAGLGPIVTAFKELRSRGGDLVIHAPSAAAFKVLELAGFSRTFTITAPPGELSRQELKILGFVTRAMQNREIARELGISEATVRHHLSKILAKLNAPTRTAAASYALRQRLVPLPEP